MKEKQKISISPLKHCYKLKNRTVRRMVQTFGASLYCCVFDLVIDMQFKNQEELRQIVTQYYYSSTDAPLKFDVLGELLIEAWGKGQKNWAEVEDRRINKLRDDVFILEYFAGLIHSSDKPMIFSNVSEYLSDIEITELDKANHKLTEAYCDIATNALLGFSRIDLIDAVLWLDANECSFVQNYPSVLIKSDVEKIINQYRNVMVKSELEKIINKWESVLRVYDRDFAKRANDATVKRLNILFESLRGATNQELQKKYPHENIARTLKIARENDIIKIQTLFPELISPLDGSGFIL